MLSYSQRRDLSLLYLMKQYTNQAKCIDIFISFEIQFEKKLLRLLEKKFFEKIKTKIIKIGNKNKQMDRSRHRRCSVRKGVFRNFAKFTGKHLCQSLFLNKVAGLRPATLLKKRPWHRCFPVNFARFLRTPFLQNTSGRLLLDGESESKK